MHPTQPFPRGDTNQAGDSSIFWWLILDGSVSFALAHARWREFHFDCRQKFCRIQIPHDRGKDLTKIDFGPVGGGGSRGAPWPDVRVIPSIYPWTARPWNQAL